MYLSSVYAVVLIPYHHGHENAENVNSFDLHFLGGILIFVLKL